MPSLTEASEGAVADMGLPQGDDVRSSCSLVAHIVDLLLSLQAPVGALQLRLVEGLRLVHRLAVRSPELVSVQILLSPPGGAIPFLAVTAVASRQRVRPLFDLQLGRVLENGVLLTSPEHGVVVCLRAQVAGTGCCRHVICWLHVGRSVKHGSRAVAATPDLHSLVVTRNKFAVEAMKDGNTKRAKTLRKP